MKVLFKTPLRGFFRHLQSEHAIHATMQFPQTVLYETQSAWSHLVKRIARWSLWDYLGIIQTPKAQAGDCDIYGSFNRFLRADKPYFIYVENPTALYHYSLCRGKSFLGKRSIQKAINDHQLKALICMSEACKSTFEQVCAKVPDACMLTRIYPLVPDNPFVNEKQIISRCEQQDTLKLLYIAQGLRFLSKGALEIVEAFTRLQTDGLNLSLTIVTSLQEMNKEIIDTIQHTDGITLYDFKFSFSEMQELYASHHILLIPSSDDSFNLTVLEAMKAGLPALASRLYAIPEMIADGENGYLTDPAWWFFDEHNIPNPAVWNHRKETIYSGKRNERITKFLEEKIRLLYANRDLLKQLSLNSYHKAMTPPFSRDYIANQWNELFNKIG